MFQVTGIVGIVLIDDVIAPGIIESATTYEDGMTVYMVRCAYTGTLYGREAFELVELSADRVAQVQADMEILTPAVPELEIVHRSVGGFLITRGCVLAEIASARREPRPTPVMSDMLVIGVNASANMFA